MCSDIIKRGRVLVLLVLLLLVLLLLLFTVRTRLCILRQQHEALASMSFFTRIISFGTLYRNFYHARGEGPVSSTSSLSADYLRPLVKLVLSMSGSTKAGVAY